MAEVTRITPRQAQEQLDRGETIVFVDVRDRSQYEQTHITGALSVPKTELDTRIREIPTGKPVVTY